MEQTDLSEHPDPAEPGASLDESPEALYEEALEWFSREGVEEVFNAPRRLRGMAGCQALVELGRQWRALDPQLGATWNVFADLLASRIEPGENGAHDLEDFRCHVALDLVIAHLSAHQLAPAETALARAAQAFQRGTGDEHLKAELLEIWALVYSCQREIDKAMQAMHAVLAIYGTLGDRHLQGRAFYRMSLLEDRDDRTEEVLRLVEEGLLRLDEAREPDLYLATIRRQVACLIKLGRFRDARMRLFASLRSYQEHGGDLGDLRRIALEGLINAGLGKLDAAERDLVKAVDGFGEAGLAFTAGIVALDLSAVYFEQGYPEDARTLGLLIVEVFQGLKIDDGTQALLLLLGKALAEGSADAELLRRTALFLREDNPDSRLHPRI